MREIRKVFVDENLLPVGRALAHVGAGVVYPGHPEFPEVPIGAKDVDWLPIIGERDLLLISRDSTIRTRPGELMLFQQHAVRAVFLTGKKDLTPRESLLLVLKYWDKIDRLGRAQGDGPWALGLTTGTGPKVLRV